MAAELKPEATILIVDDDPMILRLLGRMLRPYGLNVITAGGVLLARQLTLHCVALDKAFDLVLTDIDMFDGTGFELARGLVQDLKDPPHFLFMSALVDAPRQKEAALLGGELFDKADLALIAKSVAHWIEGKKRP